MDLESVIATIASLVAIFAFAKNDTSLFLLLKKTFLIQIYPNTFLWEVNNL